MSSITLLVLERMGFNAELLMLLVDVFVFGLWTWPSFSQLGICMDIELVDS